MKFFECKKERKLLKHKLVQIKKNYIKTTGYKRIIEIINYIKNAILKVYFTYFYLIFLFFSYPLKDIFLIKIFHLFIIFIYFKYFLKCYLLFIYNCNVIKFNKIINIIKKYEYYKIVYNKDDDLEAIINNIYNNFSHNINSIIYIYIFLMKKIFFYYKYNDFMNVSINYFINETNKKGFKECQEFNNKNKANCEYIFPITKFNKIVLLKNIYFCVFQLIFDLKENNYYLDKKKKEKLYHKIKNVFKKKYKKEYELMKENENIMFIVYQLFHNILKELFDFTHFFIFLFICLFYLLKGYYYLSINLNLLNCKNVSFMNYIKQNKKKNEKNVNENKNIFILLINSLDLLNSIDIEKYKDNKGYNKDENFENKDIDKNEENNIYLKKMENKYKLIEKNLEKSLILIKSMYKKKKYNNKIRLMFKPSKNKIKNKNEKLTLFTNKISFNKNVYESVSKKKKKDNISLDSNKNIKNMTYDIYLYNDEKCKINDINEEKNNSLNEYTIENNELPQKKDKPLNICDNELNDKKKKKIAEYFFNTQKKQSVENLLQELKKKIKKKEYTYVEKKLCYDVKENTFYMKILSLKDKISKEKKTQKQENLIVENKRINVCINENDSIDKELFKYPLLNIQDTNNQKNNLYIQTNNINDNENNSLEDDEDNLNELNFLKPIQDISKFRNQIAQSIIQRSL